MNRLCYFGRTGVVVKVVSEAIQLINMDKIYPSNNFRMTEGMIEVWFHVICLVPVNPQSTNEAKRTLKEEPVTT